MHLVLLICTLNQAGTSNVRNIELEIDKKLVPQQQRQAEMDEAKRQLSEEEEEEVKNGNTSSSSTLSTQETHRRSQILGLQVALRRSLQYYTTDIKEANFSGE